MSARVAADVLVAIHIAFVVFVVVGGLAVVRHPVLAWAHVPAVVWGGYAELTASVCPLTPLENTLRRSAGEAGYTGSFVEHYLLPILYPASLTPVGQRWIGAAVIAINVVAYAWVIARMRRRRQAPHTMKTTQTLAQRTK